MSVVKSGKEILKEDLDKLNKELLAAIEEIEVSKAKYDTLVDYLEKLGDVEEEKKNAITEKIKERYYENSSAVKKMRVINCKIEQINELIDIL